MQKYTFNPLITTAKQFMISWKIKPLIPWNILRNYILIDLFFSYPSILKGYGIKCDFNLWKFLSVMIQIMFDNAVVNSSLTYSDFIAVRVSYITLTVAQKRRCLMYIKNFLLKSHS